MEYWSNAIEKILIHHSGIPVLHFKQCFGYGFFKRIYCVVKNNTSCGVKQILLYLFIGCNKSDNIFK